MFFDFISQKRPVLCLSFLLQASTVIGIPALLHGRQYSNGTNATIVDIESILSQMTFLEKLAQTRNVGGIFGPGVSYDPSSIESFNNGNGGGSISFGTYQNSAPLAAAEMAKIITANQDENRFGIPLINVADSVNGVTLLNTTLFPATLSMSQSWNIDLYSEVIDAISKENRAVGVHWVLSPDLDLAREPRFGRVGETYGEDGYLVGRFGVAYVKNMQAEDENGFVRVATTVKHWIFGSCLSGINQAPIWGGINEFYNTYLTPYLPVLKETNPLSVMPSYSTYDSVPMTTNTRYTKELLRDELGFDGVIISDYAAITQVFTRQKTTKDLTTAGLKSLFTTIDHELGPPQASGFQQLETMESDPAVNAAVTEAARKILTLKYKTKTFEQPVPDLTKLNSTLRTSEHMAKNLEISRESIVLLKNEGLLPLDASLLSKIAVIGPLANVINPGSYAASDYKTGTTILNGIQKISSDVTYSLGCYRNNDTDFESLKAEAVASAQSASLAVVVLGAASSSLDSNVEDRTDGEGYDHASLEFLGVQPQLLQAIVETGTPVVLIASGGQVFTMEYAVENAGAIIHSFLQGEVTGDALAEILTGETNPSGRLTLSIPRFEAAIPAYYNWQPTERKELNGVGTDYQFPLINKTARYPFGFGLSYTTFAVTDVSISNGTSTTGTISISATVANTGSLQGKEVLQVYFGQFAPEIERPYKNLIRFAKVDLASGESQQVSFDLPAEELGYYVNGVRQVDADNYTFWVGTSSADEDLVTIPITVQ